MMTRGRSLSCFVERPPVDSDDEEMFDDPDTDSEPAPPENSESEKEDSESDADLNENGVTEFEEIGSNAKKLLDMLLEKFKDTNDESCSASLKKLDYDNLGVEDITPEEAKKLLEELLKPIRKLRTLHEVLQEASENLMDPSKHPCRPAKAISAYTFFRKEHHQRLLDLLKKQGWDTKDIGPYSKLTSQEYQKLSEKEKNRYKKMAEQARKESQEKREEFQKHWPTKEEEKPNLADKKMSSEAFRLFFLNWKKQHQHDEPLKHGKSSRSITSLNQARAAWKAMTVKEKVHWVKKLLQNTPLYKLMQNDLMIYFQAKGMPEGRRQPFSLFVKKRYENYRHEERRDRLKLVSEDWKKLSPAEKEPYNEESEKDKVRYEKEMKAFLARLDPFENTVYQNMIKSKQKRPIDQKSGRMFARSAYLLFLQENKGKNIQSLQESWKAMDPEEKRSYMEHFEEEKLRIAQEESRGEKRREHSDDEEDIEAPEPPPKKAKKAQVKESPQVSAKTAKIAVKSLQTLTKKKGNQVLSASESDQEPAASSKIKIASPRKAQTPMKGKNEDIQDERRAQELRSPPKTRLGTPRKVKTPLKEENEDRQDERRAQELRSPPKMELGTPRKAKTPLKSQETSQSENSMDEKISQELLSPSKRAKKGTKDVPETPKSQKNTETEESQDERGPKEFKSPPRRDKAVPETPKSIKSPPNSKRSLETDDSQDDSSISFSQSSNKDKKRRKTNGFEDFDPAQTSTQAPPLDSSYSLTQEVDDLFGGKPKKLKKPKPPPKSLFHYYFTTYHPEDKEKARKKWAKIESKPSKLQTYEEAYNEVRESSKAELKAYLKELPKEKRIIFKEKYKAKMEAQDSGSEVPSPFAISEVSVKQ